MKIVVLDGYTENPGDLSWEELGKLGTLTVYDRTPKDDREIARRIAGAEAVYTNKTPLSAQVIREAESLKYIGVLATGYNVVDGKAARDRGVPVCNIPAYGTEAVGQFAMALLLEICHHVGHHDRAVHEGKWTTNPDWCFWDFSLIELAGKTMGIIGFGRIGRTTGRLARAFGMNVLAYDKYPEANQDKEGFSYVELEEIWRQSDVIALHCPLFAETRELINQKTIGKMKDGVIILNNSRGELICEADLAEALKKGKVYAAGVDVVSTEPIQADNPLLTAPNCIITPHISWASRESRQRLMDTAVENLRSFCLGRPQNVVNF